MHQYVSVRIDGKDKNTMSKQVAVTASEGHRKFGQLLKRVYNSGEHLVVERDGFPVAVMLSYPEYQSLKRQRAIEAFKALTRIVGTEADNQSLTEDDLLSELRDTRQNTFEEVYGKAEPTS